MRLGLDISPHHASAILADEAGASVCALRTALPQEGGSPAIWLAAMETARDALRRAGATPLEVLAVALSMNAPLDAAGCVQRGRDTDGWTGFDVPRALREHLGIANTIAGNRVVCEALGETRYGALRSESGKLQWLYVHLGHTLGAAAGQGEAVWRGATCGFTDIGALCIDRDGPVGGTGRRGPLDAFCSGDGFVSRAAGYGITLRTTKEVWDMAKSNFAAKSICDDYVRRLAHGLGLAITLLRPECTVIGGSIARDLGERLLKPLGAMLPDFCAAPPQLTLAQLADDAAVLGAVTLASMA